MKKQTLLALPCVLSCLALNADDYNSSSAVQSGDKQPFKSTYERIEMTEITPNAGPIVQGGVDAYVQADYILWHASEGGLSFAAKGGDNTRGMAEISNNVLSQGSVIAPDFKTSSGFKVGLGLDFHYDGWDLGATYTWLHTHANRTVVNPNVTANYGGVLYQIAPVIVLPYNKVGSIVL